MTENHIICFGPRPDDRKKVKQTNNNFITNLYWAAYRGEMIDKNFLSLCRDDIHQLSLVKHAILGGSFDTVKMLIEAEPDFFLTYDAFQYALCLSKLKIASLLHAELKKKSPHFIPGLQDELEWACARVCPDTVINLMLLGTTTAYFEPMFCKSLIEKFRESTKNEENNRKVHDALTLLSGASEEEFDMIRRRQEEEDAGSQAVVLDDSENDTD